MSHKYGARDPHYGFTAKDVVFRNVGGSEQAFCPACGERVRGITSPAADAKNTRRIGGRGMQQRLARIDTRDAVPWTHRGSAGRRAKIARTTTVERATSLTLPWTHLGGRHSK